jgi:transglutaminase-like putative cysteine protease/Flp pilus assembly protein TadD
MGLSRFDHLLDPSRSSCVYALTVIDSLEAGTALLQLGASGAMKAFWNGRDVVSDSTYRRADPDRTVTRLRAREGPNRLLVKICSEEEGTLGLYARLTDERYRAWPTARSRMGDAAVFAAVVPASSASVRIRGPLETLVNEVEVRGRDADRQLLAASFLARTGAEARTSHRARDLARAACHRGRLKQACLLLNEVGLDRNERIEGVRTALELDPRDADVLLTMAREMLDGPEPRLARSFIEKALVLAPAEPEALALEAELTALMGFPRTALSEAMSLLEQHPRVPRLIALAADLAEQSGSAATAITMADRLLGVRFDDADSLELVARAALARGDTKALVARLEDLARLSPHDREVVYLAAELFEGAGKSGLAEELLRAWTEQAPHDPRGWKLLGLDLVRHGQREAGLTALGRAAMLKPQDSWLRDYLGHLEPRPRFEESFVVQPERFLSWRSPKGDEDVRYLVDQHVVRVHQSGLASRYRQIAVEINSRDAARRYRIRSIQLTPESQRLKVVAARVFRPDGAVENSVARGTVPVSEPWYRLYYDVVAEMIEMPPLEPGDVVELSYLIQDTAESNAFNDYFGDFVFIEEDVPKELWRYVLIAPQTRRFYFGPLPRKRVTHTSERDGQRIVELFESRDVPAILVEHDMPGLSSTAAYLHISTYENWEKLGNWYRGLIRHQLTTDERIRSQARRLVRGIGSDTERVRAIYEWVISSTRYVGLEFGIHGYKPYRAPLVVSRGFGDCKDKASLLVAMLGEVDIDAEFVLVRTRDLGAVKPLPASLAIFNHAIVHVRSPDIWLDGTAEHHGIRELPFGDQEATSLRIGTQRAVFGTTPAMPPDRNSETTTLDVLLDPDGDARLEVRTVIRGRDAAALRQTLEASHTRRERFESLLASSYHGARLGDLEVSDLERVSRPVNYSFTAYVPAYARLLDETLEVPADPGIDLTSRFARLASREQVLVVGPSFVSSRRAIVHVPSGHEVAHLPTPTEIDTRFGKLSLGVDVDGDEINLSRRFELAVDEVSPADYADFVVFAREVDDALAARIRLERRR